MHISDILMQPGRVWSPRPGASDADLTRLEAAASRPIPSPILELLRYSNGGEGELALPPLLFRLDTVQQIIDGIARDEFPGFLSIGGNGSIERIALDCRQQPPFPVVAIDPVAGIDSVEVIATDAEALVAAIGLVYGETPDA